MAQQIKKKYLAPDSVDGSKIKLGQGEAIRIVDSSNVEVDLIKLGALNEILINGEEAALKSQVDTAQAAADAAATAIQTHIDNPDDAHSASSIAYGVTGAYVNGDSVADAFSSVETTFATLAGELSTHTHTAADISYDNATSGLSATDIQSAVDEVKALVVANGNGDFFADGSVPMTGDLDMDGNSIVSQAGLTIATKDTTADDTDSSDIVIKTGAASGNNSSPGVITLDAGWRDVNFGANRLLPILNDNTDFGNPDKIFSTGYFWATRSFQTVLHSKDVNDLQGEERGRVTTDAASVILEAMKANGNVKLLPNGTGHIDASSAAIKNLANPAAAQDAATKAYVDGEIAAIPAADLSPYLKHDGTVALTGALVPAVSNSMALGAGNKYFNNVISSQYLLMSGPGQIAGSVALNGSGLRISSGSNVLQMGNGQTAIDLNSNSGSDQFLDLKTVFKISNLKAPSLDADAATKKYVDDGIAAIPAADLSPYLKHDGTVAMTDALKVVEQGVEGPDAGFGVHTSTYNSYVYLAESESFISADMGTMNVSGATLNVLATQGNLTVQAQTGTLNLLSSVGISVGGSKLTGLNLPVDGDEAANKTYVDDLVNPLLAIVSEKHKIVLSATDITRQWVDLPHEAIDGTIVAFADRLALHEGASDDYTVSVVSGKTRITFANDIATGGPSALVDGDTMYFKYKRSTI